jgi:CBS domain containing-hemolysin-like protein
VVDARLDVEELMEHFDRPRPQGKFESVGGLLIHLLGRVPQVNDSVVIHDLELTVKSADERRAKEVLVRPINSQESPADQA